LFEDLVDVQFVTIYKAKSNFKSNDARYLQITKGEIVTGLYST